MLGGVKLGKYKGKERKDYCKEKVCLGGKRYRIKYHSKLIMESKNGLG